VQHARRRELVCAAALIDPNRCSVRALACVRLRARSQNQTEREAFIGFLNVGFNSGFHAEWLSRALSCSVSTSSGTARGSSDAALEVHGVCVCVEPLHVYSPLCVHIIVVALATRRRHSSIKCREWQDGFSI